VSQEVSGGICDRTPKVRDLIIELLNSPVYGSLNIQHCSEVTAEHLTRISNLDLTGGGASGTLSSLQAVDFDGLTGLQELNLKSTSLG
jgi:hypothetical protein